MGGSTPFLTNSQIMMVVTYLLEIWSLWLIFWSYFLNNFRGIFFRCFKTTSYRTYSMSFTLLIFYDWLSLFPQLKVWPIQHLYVINVFLNTSETWYFLFQNNFISIILDVTTFVYYQGWWSLFSNSRYCHCNTYICIKLSVPSIWIYISSDAQLSPLSFRVFRSVCW